jgi:phytoene synthase
MPDDRELTNSFRYCREIARSAARNFYYGFALLPPAKRDALRERLKAWYAVLDDALDGRYGKSRLLPAFHQTVRRYAIPPSYFHDLMAGAEMDLSVRTYPSFELLERYCYCVAGTVGLCCVHVFGFNDPTALELASKLGTAFQLTNILRDVREDYAMDRIYLPQEDLNRFGCMDYDLGSPVASPAFIEVMRFEANRARQFYAEGAPLLNLVNVDSRAALWTLIRIYSGILSKIEAIHYDVLDNPHPRLSTAEKAWIMLRAGVGLFDTRSAFRT